MLCYAYSNEMNESNVNSHECWSLLRECCMSKCVKVVVGPWWKMILDVWRATNFMWFRRRHHRRCWKRGIKFIFSVREFKKKYILAFTHTKHFTGNFLCLSHKKADSIHTSNNNTHTHWKCICMRMNNIFMVIYLFNFTCWFWCIYFSNENCFALNGNICHVKLIFNRN